MTNIRMITAGLCLCFTVACGESQDTNEEMMDQGVRQLGDEFVPPINDMGMNEADSTTLADMSTPTEVTDCASLCVRFDECNRNLLGPRDTCEDACADLEPLAGFEGFLTCVDQAECSRLDSCVVPEPPPPTCEEVCASLETCEPTNVLPEGFTDVDSCVSACADDAKSSAIVICGARL